MKMLTQAIINVLPKHGATDGKPESEKNVVVKFFNPCGAATWYVLEGEQCENGDWEFYGYVDLFSDQQGGEYGYFLLSQLTEIRLPFGLNIERDRNFESTMADILA